MTRNRKARLCVGFAHLAHLFRIIFMTLGIAGIVLSAVMFAYQGADLAPKMLACGLGEIVLAFLLQWCEKSLLRDYEQDARQQSL